MNPILNIIGSMAGMGGIGGIGGAGGISGNMMNAGGTQNGGVNPLAGALSIFNALKEVSDPMPMIQAMAQTNPQVKQAIDIVNQNGGNMQSTFYALAKQKGVNPDEILNMIK